MITCKTEFTELFLEGNALELDCGDKLENVRVAYQAYGKLNKEGTNVILICHALTGLAHAAGICKNVESDKESSPDLLAAYTKQNLEKTGWWDPLIGPGKLFDTNKYFVLCPNILGSCYGTSGPVTINRKKGKNLGPDFPPITVRDMVKVQKELIYHLGISKIKAVTGGSLGGMQVIEWAIMFPELVESIIPIATSAAHSPWAIGLNEAARNAVKNDPEWKSGYYENQPEKGLKLARKIAMISYRSYDSFMTRFKRERINNSSYFSKENIFQVENYLNYQGEKLLKRFDANTYNTLSVAMDLHDVSQGRGTLEEVLGSIKAKTLVIGISTDMLYPAEEQKMIASMIKNSRYSEIESIFGHDAFLIEFDQLENIISGFIS